MNTRTYYDFGGKVWSITHDSDDTKGLVAKIYDIKHKIYALRQDYHEEIEIANPRDYLAEFWKHNYLVLPSPFSTFLVNADNKQDSIDIVIDYCVERGYMGLFLDDEMIKEKTEEGFLDEHYCGGNHGHYLSEPDFPMIERVK